MTFLKNILGRILALWALIVFAAMMILMFIPTWITLYIKEPKGTAIFRKMSRFFMDLFLYLTGFPPRVKGTNNFKKGQAYVVVCNHRSLLDVPLSTPYIPGPNKTIAKKEMASIPVFGMMYKRGSILVDRKSDKSRRESIEEMKKVLSLGMHMCIYPEGTRNTSSEPIKPFHDGAFRLAVTTGNSIIPMIIFNSRKANPPDKGFFLWPVKLYMDFLPELNVMPDETVEHLKARVYDQMKNHILQHQ